jgi:hypothetical protein
VSHSLSPYELLNVWNSLYETWCISFINSSNLSDHRCIYSPIVARQRLGKNVIVFFFNEKPILFAICKNTFSKWKVGGRMWQRIHGGRRICGGIVFCASSSYQRKVAPSVLSRTLLFLSLQKWSLFFRFPRQHLSCRPPTFDHSTRNNDWWRVRFCSFFWYSHSLTSEYSLYSGWMHPVAYIMTK